MLYCYSYKMLHWCVVALSVCSLILTTMGSIPPEKEPSSRIPRCIVVQKQSGSKDSSDYEDDYKGPTPKGPRTNKFTAHTHSSDETEDFNEKFERFKTLPVKWLNHKFLSKFIGY